ncbi:hypothetical protein [Laspinema sp. D2d]|nr:hypothetical protein [Laspinema sp. D2d]
MCLTLPDKEERHSDGPDEGFYDLTSRFNLARSRNPWLSGMRSL